MGKHLQAVVLAQVDVDVLVYGPCIARIQVGHFDAKCLFIILTELGLVGVNHTADARRQDVVHRFAITILLDVHR